MTETTEAMLARVRASFDRQGMMSTLGVEVTAAFSVMPRPGLSG